MEIEAPNGWTRDRCENVKIPTFDRAQLINPRLEGFTYGNQPLGSPKKKRGAVMSPKRVIWRLLLL